MAEEMGALGFEETGGNEGTEERGGKVGLGVWEIERADWGVEVVEEAATVREGEVLG